MKLLNVSRYNPMIQDTVCIGQLVEIVNPESYPVKAVILFQDYNDNKEVRCYKQTVVFFNNSYNNLADRIKKVPSGEYIVVQLSNRKNNSVVCVNFGKRNHYMKVRIDEQKFLWIFFGRPGMISFVKKEIKGEKKDALEFYIPTKGKNDERVKNKLIMYENDKYPRIKKANEILTRCSSQNLLVAAVCSDPFNKEFSCFRLVLPDGMQENPANKTPASEIIHEDTKSKENPGETNPGDEIINLGFAEGQNKSIKTLWEENHKQFIKFVAWEWIPDSNKQEELAAYKKIKESCQRFLESLNVA